MSRDGYGMPVPDGGSPLPWSANERRDERTNGRRVDDYDGVRVAGVWDDDDRWFILHAANNIIPAREIVRRLIEWHCGPIDKHVSLCDIVSDAEKLWAKMQSEVSDGA